MKCRRQFLPVVLMGLLLLSGCGKVNGNVPVIADSSSSEESLSDVALSESMESDETKDESVESQDKINATNKIAGVSIDFDYTRMSGKASNQIALWIESESGEIIKTLFVTDFTASRRGYENREDALSHWVTSANPGELTDTEIDAISSATPQTGAQHFVWNLTDDNGQRVQDGRYYVRLSKYAVADMLKRNDGKIIFVSSVTGHIGHEDETIYTMTKFAQRGLSQAIDKELGKCGIKTCVMCPSATKTEFEVGFGRTEEGVAASGWETPEDVAEGILYACVAKNTVWEIRMR